jgi:hypothetical protein
VEVLPHSFLTSALNEGKRPDACPGRFTTAKRVARQRSPLYRPRRPRVGVNYSSTLSLTSVLDGDGWSTPCPNRSTPGNDPVPTVYEAGWAPGLVRRVRKISAPLRFDPRTVPESLYRMRYPGSRISPPMALYLTQGMVAQEPKAQQSFPGAIPAREWYQNAQLGQSAYAGLAGLMSGQVVTLQREFKNAATRSNV